MKVRQSLIAIGLVPKKNPKKNPPPQKKAPKVLMEYQKKKKSKIKNQKLTGGFKSVDGPPILQDCPEHRAVYHVDHGLTANRIE